MKCILYSTKKNTIWQDWKPGIVMLELLISIVFIIVSSCTIGYGIHVMQTLKNKAQEQLKLLEIISLNAEKHWQNCECFKKNNNKNIHYKKITIQVPEFKDFYIHQQSPSYNIHTARLTSDGKKSSDTFCIGIERS